MFIFFIFNDVYATWKLKEMEAAPDCQPASLCHGLKEQTPVPRAKANRFQSQAPNFLGGQYHQTPL